MRNGWITSTSLFNWITGVMLVVISISGVIGLAVAGDFVNQLFSAFSSATGEPGVDNAGTMITIVPILICLALLLQGVARIACGWGLWGVRSWARVMAIVLHVLGGLEWLGFAILLIIMNFALTSIVPFLFVIPEALFVVGLLLPSTAERFSFQGSPAGGGVSPTALSPMPENPGMMNPAPYAMPQMAAAPAGGTMGGGTMGGGTMGGGTMGTRGSSGGGYGRAGSGGVAKTELADAPMQTLAWLVERNGPRPGREHRLKEENTIGRDGSRCEVAIDEVKVSGEHARIKLEHGQFVFYDLASRNHSFVNDRQVQKQVLQDGDQIRLGPNVKLSFMLAGKGSK